MKIYTEQTLSSFSFWGNAKSNVLELNSAQLDDVESILEDLYPDGISDVELNDFFSYDFDTVKEWLGIDENENEDED